MSIATDIRNYADTAVSQGKHLVEQAQAQLNDVSGQANEFYGKTKDLAGKASAAVVDLRAQAEKAINLDAIKTAVEPYLAQVKGYRHDLTDRVTDRAESLFDAVRSDARVAKLLDTAGVVVEAVQEKVVKPVQSLSGRAPKPTNAAPKPATPKPAAPKPAAAKPATAKPATKPTARKAPAKRATKS